MPPITFSLFSAYFRHTWTLICDVSYETYFTYWINATCAFIMDYKRLCQNRSHSCASTSGLGNFESYIQFVPITLTSAYTPISLVPCIAHAFEASFHVDACCVFFVAIVQTQLAFIDHCKSENNLIGLTVTPNATLCNCIHHHRQGKWNMEIKTNNGK